MNSIDDEKLKQAFQLYRSRWSREDDLINQRITWLGVSQAILVAAYGFTLQFDVEKMKSLYDKNPEIPLKLSTFLNMVPLIGMAIALTILLGILAAVCAAIVVHRKWRSEWQVLTQAPAANNPHWKAARIYVTTLTTIVGFGSALFMPFAFFLFWHAVRYQPAWIQNF